MNQAKPYKTAASEKIDTDAVYLMYSTAKSRQDKSLQNLYPINLVNSAGEIVRSWNAGCPIFSATVYKKFQIAVLCFADLDLVLPGGTGGLFRLIDAESKLVFQYENILIHHTFERKNENFFFLQNRALSELEKKKFKLTFAGKNIGAERLIEVNQKGETLWSWDFIDDGNSVIHSRIDTSLPELTHANSVRFYNSNIFSKNPALLLSFRNLSAIAMIDYVTKKLLWLSPKNAFDYQHDATLIDEKNILAFNNGIHDEFMNL